MLGCLDFLRCTEGGDGAISALGTATEVRGWLLHGQPKLVLVCSTLHPCIISGSVHRPILFGAFVGRVGGIC